MLPPAHRPPLSPPEGWRAFLVLDGTTLLQPVFQAQPRALKFAQSGAIWRATRPLPATGVACEPHPV